MNERDRHLQTGRSWLTNLEHRGARGVERLLASGEAALFSERPCDQAPDSDPSASYLDPSQTLAAE